MTASSVAMAVLLLAAFTFFGFRAWRLYRVMRLAKQPLARTDQPLRRLAGLAVFVFGNKKLFIFSPCWWQSLVSMRWAAAFSSHLAACKVSTVTLASMGWSSCSSSSA
jgi:hypothetical protein